MSAKPRILINASYLPRPEGGYAIVLKSSYAESVARAGGIPVILPPMDDADSIREEVSRAQGVLLIGGDDLSSSRYGAEPSPLEFRLDPVRENFDFALLAETLKQDKALFAVCLGFQIFNVHCGGTLYRDLPSENTSEIRHQKKTRPNYVTHKISVTAGTKLDGIIGAREIEVNSSHHQGINRLGDNLIASAVAPDSVVEAIESPAHRFAVGVQWHPEDMQDEPRQRSLFEAFIEAARQPS